MFTKAFQYLKNFGRRSFLLGFPQVPILVEVYSPHHGTIAAHLGLSSGPFCEPKRNGRVVDFIISHHPFLRNFSSQVFIPGPEFQV